MEELRYSVRASLRRAETEYRLRQDALEWDGGRIAFADIAAIRLHAVPGLLVAAAGPVAQPGMRCIVRARQGGGLVIPSQHFVGLGRFEDRGAAFTPFATALARRVHAANPEARLLTGLPPGLWWLWAFVLLLTVLVALGALAVLIAAFGAGGPWLDGFVALLFLAGLGMTGASVLTVLLRGRSRPLRLPGEGQAAPPVPPPPPPS
jgi:hypothetical protein